MSTLVDDMVRMIRLLESHNALPGTIEVTQATYEALKRECHHPATPGEFNSFMGVNIVVRD